MRKTRFSRHLLYLTVLTMITAVLGMALNIYQTANKPQPLKVTPQELAPLNPKLDTNLLERLSQREFLTPETKVATINEGVQ